MLVTSYGQFSDIHKTRNQYASLFTASATFLVEIKCLLVHCDGQKALIGEKNKSKSCKSKNSQQLPTFKRMLKEAARQLSKANIVVRLIKRVMDFQHDFSFY